MLGILRINAGISTDGDNELSMTVVDERDNIYEVDICGDTYEQLVEIIRLLKEDKIELTSKSPEPAREIQEEQLQAIPENPGKAAFAGATLADVGFVDFSSDMVEEDDEEDPGEGFGQFAESI